MRDYSIGQISRDTGVKAPTIRFYEQIGLLPAPARSASNRRRYSTADAKRLRFIRHCRDLGFHVQDIRALLDLASQPQQSCADADAIADRHLNAVRRRIAQLTSLKNELERMVAKCGHGRVADCRVLESLDDHALCEHHKAQT